LIENNLSWNDYKDKYSSKLIQIGLDQTLAMNLLTKKFVFIEKMSKSRKYAHLFWLNISFVFILSSIVTSIMWFFMDDLNSLYPIISIIVTILLVPSVRKSACQLIIDETLENESFYNLINDFSKDINQEILVIKDLAN
jgi:hypothetical protein